MLCPNCIKLVSLPAKKKCLKCQGNVNKNIAALCESCSNREKLCEACLKLYYHNKTEDPNNRHILGGCQTCSKRK